MVEQTIPADRWPGVPGGLVPGQVVTVRRASAIRPDVTVESVWRLAVTTYTGTDLMPVFRDDLNGEMWAWTVLETWVPVVRILERHSTVAVCLTRDPMPLPTGVIHSGE